MEAGAGMTMGRKGSGVTSAAKLKLRCRVLPTKPLDCWLWKDGCDDNGEPRLWMFDPHLGRSHAVSGPRAAAIVAGLTIPKGGRAWMGCMNAGCVNPEHVLVGTMAEWGKWKADNKVWRDDPVRIAITTATVRRHRAKLDMEKARQIRAMGVKQISMAALFGVSESAISAVVQGNTWRESNPFAGLGARA